MTSKNSYNLHCNTDILYTTGYQIITNTAEGLLMTIKIPPNGSLLPL